MNKNTFEENVNQMERRSRLCHIAKLASKACWVVVWRGGMVAEPVDIPLMPPICWHQHYYLVIEMPWTKEFSAVSTSFLPFLPAPQWSLIQVRLFLCMIAFRNKKVVHTFFSSVWQSKWIVQVINMQQKVNLKAISSHEINTIFFKLLNMC